MILTKKYKGRSFISVEYAPNGRSTGEKGNAGDKNKKGEKGSLERPLFLNRSLLVGRENPTRSIKERSNATPLHTISKK